MPVAFMLLYIVHVLSALVWMGSSFVVAQAKGRGAERQYPLQTGATLLAFLTGGYLWSTLHSGAFGPMELVLAIGVACAVIAAGAQGMLVGGSLRRLRKGVLDETEARRRITTGHRIGAGLVAIGLLCMAGAHLARAI
jgi:hypothetical protein